MNEFIYKGQMKELQRNRGLLIIAATIMLAVFILYWLLLNINFNSYLSLLLLAGICLVTTVGTCIFLVVDREISIRISEEMPDAEEYRKFFNWWWNKHKSDCLLQSQPNLYTARIYDVSRNTIYFFTECINGKVYQGQLKAEGFSNFSKGDIIHLNVVGDQFSMLDIEYWTCLV